MDGDVQRADAQIADALQLPLGEVGEGDVVPLQKAEAGVIVFKIQGLPQPPGELVDEAEDTVVGTGPRPIHQIALKIQTQVTALRLPDMKPVLRAVRTGEKQMQVPVIGIELIVQDVEDALSVDAEQPVADCGTALQRAAGVHAADHILHLVHQ